MRKIVLTNDKGGVGKTTTVANLAVGLARKGRKTLVIDMDPQADVTYALLGQRAPEAANGYVPPTTHALLTGHYSIDQVTLEVARYPNLFHHPFECRPGGCRPQAGTTPDAPAQPAGRVAC